MPLVIGKPLIGLPSLDKDFHIQLDSDSNRVGGVIPDIRFPINDSVMDQLYLDSIDVELNYAINELYSWLGIDETHPGEARLFLDPIFPNPVTSNATISYRLEESTDVTIVIYDLCGRMVTTLVNESQMAGRYSVKWSIGELYSGIYFYRITTRNGSITRKCIVMSH